MATKKMFLFKRGVIAASVELAIVVGLVVAFVKNVSDLSTEMDKNAKSADQFRSDIDVLVDTYKKLDSVSDADLEKGIEAGRRALEKSKKTLDGYIDKSTKGAVAEQNRIDRIRGGLSVLERESLLRKQNLVHQENAKKKAEETEFIEKLRTEELERQAELTEEAFKKRKEEGGLPEPPKKLVNQYDLEKGQLEETKKWFDLLVEMGTLEFANIDKLSSALKDMPDTVIPEEVNQELSLLEKTFKHLTAGAYVFEDSAEVLKDALSDLAIEGAESFEELGVAMGNVVRDVIKALIAQGVTAAVASALTEAPWPLNLVAAPIAGATAATLFNTLVPKFEHGGIVPGSSFSGDNVPALMNSREMVLTQGQQANLFKMANGHGVGGQGEVDFRIKGTDLVGVLKNQGKQDKRFR